MSHNIGEVYFYVCILSFYGLPGNTRPKVSYRTILENCLPKNVLLYINFNHYIDN